MIGLIHILSPQEDVAMETQVQWCGVMWCFLLLILTCCFPLTNIFNEMSEVWLLGFNWCEVTLFLLQAAKKKKKKNSSIARLILSVCTSRKGMCVSFSQTFSCLQVESLHGKWNWSVLSNTYRDESAVRVKALYVIYCFHYSLRRNLKVNRLKKH